MSTRQKLLVSTLLGMVLAHRYLLASGNEVLQQVWSGPGASVRERAEAVNRAFTNGTPMPVIVAVLGTNFTHYYSPISRVWLGPGPEPPKTSGFLYRFGQDLVYIFTTAGLNENPLTGKFTGAVAQSTNGVWTGQPSGAANRSQPGRPDTNRTSAPAGPGR
jgi:hypothetical protein